MEPEEVTTEEQWIDAMHTRLTGVYTEEELDDFYGRNY